MSPAANTDGCESGLQCVAHRTKPWRVDAAGRTAASHGAAAAAVTHRTSSSAWSRAIRGDEEAGRDRDHGVIGEYLTPSFARARARSVCARRAIVRGQNLRGCREQRIDVLVAPAARSASRPAQTMMRGEQHFDAAGAAADDREAHAARRCAQHAVQHRSQCAMKRSIGLTATLPAAPGTSSVRGVEPMSSDTTSYRTGGWARH